MRYEAWYFVVIMGVFHVIHVVRREGGLDIVNEQWLQCILLVVGWDGTIDSST